MAELDDLSGKEVYVRRSSSYAEHIGILNKRLAEGGKPPFTILPAPEVLEDGDILEMVAAGLVPATVVDDFMADLYVAGVPEPDAARRGREPARWTSPGPSARAARSWRRR